MPERSLRSSHSRFAVAFTAGLLALLSALLSVLILGLTAARERDRAASIQIELARDAALTRYYDEVLTMSARLAAATGDGSYVARYEHTAPMLDTVIAHAESLVPRASVRAAIQATGRANQALVGLEEDSFRLLARGDRAAAYAEVSSVEYDQWKAEYRLGMDQATDLMRAQAQADEQHALQHQRVSLLIGIGAAALLLVLWMVTAWGLSRAQRVRQQMEEQLRHLAHADPLTGLANRRLFRDRLAGRLADPEESEVAVFFIDLDHFKKVNDSRGHADGDSLIVEVAGRLSDLVHGQRQALVARLGGDEFAVLVTGIRPEQAESLAERMVTSLSRPYTAATQIPVSASVGIATAQPSGQDPGAILRWADLAMYAAKSAGRGCWRRHHEPGQDRQLTPAR